MTNPRLAILAGTLALGLVACNGSAPSPVSPELVSPAPTPSGQTDAGVPVAPQARRDIPFQKILCFGDSLTFGITSRGMLQRFTLEPVEGYVPKLRQLLRREFDSTAQVINSGRGGETTDRGLQRLKIEIRSQRFDLVLLLEGVVDVNNPHPKFAQARTNLKEMMRVVKGEGIPVIIGTVPPLNDDGFRIRGIENIPTLNDIIREEAKAEGVPVADHDQAARNNEGLQGPDGLHPNDAGYEVMAQTWFEEIQKLIDEMST